MPLEWKIRRYGPDGVPVDATFAALGIEGATQTLVNQGEDTCELQFAGLRPPGAASLVFDERITVFSGSVPWFSGTVGTPERNADDTRRNAAVTIRGPWAQLAASIYMAPGAYVTNPPAANAAGVIAVQAFAPVRGSAVSSNLLLAKDQDGTLLDGMQTLRRALAYAQKAGAWFALGRLPDSLSIPAEAIRDRTVADILRAVVKWDPSLVTFFDYLAVPPRLNIVPRADLPALALRCGDGGTVAKVRVRPRPDQVVPGVCVQYVRQFSQTPQIQVQTDAGGAVTSVTVAPVAAAPLNDFRGTFVPATGPGINSGNSHFVPALGPGLEFGTGLSFVAGPSPFFRPNAPTVYVPGTGLIVQSSGGVTTAAPPAPGDVAPAAPSVPASSVASAPAYNFYSIEYELAGTPFLATGETVLRLGALAFTVELNGGDVTAEGYSPAALDVPPYGLAAMIYAGRSEIPWEGTIDLKARDVGFLNYVGRAVNVIGGDVEWENMAALCQGLTRTTATGETTLTLGLPQALGASDIQAVLRAARGFRTIRDNGLTDPLLPPSHDPLPAATGGGGGGGNHPDPGDEDPATPGDGVPGGDVGPLQPGDTDSPVSSFTGGGYTCTGKLRNATIPADPYFGSLLVTNPGEHGSDFTMTYPPAPGSTVAISATPSADACVADGDVHGDPVASCSVEASSKWEGFGNDNPLFPGQHGHVGINRGTAFERKVYVDLSGLDPEQVSRVVIYGTATASTPGGGEVVTNISQDITAQVGGVAFVRVSLPVGGAYPQGDTGFAKYARATLGTVRVSMR